VKRPSADAAVPGAGASSSAPSVRPTAINRPAAAGSRGLALGAIGALQPGLRPELMDTAERAEETQRREAEPSYRGEAFAPRWLAHDEAPPPRQPSLREMARAMTETRGELRRRRAPAAQRASGRGSGEPLQRHEAQAAAVVQHGRVEETLPRDGAKLFGTVNLCLVWQTWFAT